MNNFKIFNIKTPIWKTNSIGLAEHKLADINYVNILYKNNLGIKLFPDRYKISKEKALKYPTQFVGVQLRIIPISHLEIANRR